MAGQTREKPMKTTIRNYNIKVRMDADEYAMLDKLRALTGMSTSKILRAALQLYFHMTVK